MAAMTSRENHLFNRRRKNVYPSSFQTNYAGSSQNAGPGSGSGCLFFEFFLLQFLWLFSCTVIFECLAFFLHLWWKHPDALCLFFEMKRNWSFCGEYTLTPRDTEDSFSSTC